MLKNLRIIAIAMGSMFLCQEARTADSPRSNPVIAKLAKEAEVRYKETVKERKRLSNRYSELQGQWTNARRKISSDETEAIRHEQKVLDRTRDIVAREQNVLRWIVAMDKQGVPDRHELTSYARRQAEHFDDAERTLARHEKEAKERHESTRSKGAPLAVRTIMDRELEAFRQEWIALRRERDVTEQALAATGTEPLAYWSDRIAEARQRERDRYRRWSNQREEAKRSLAALIAAVGLSAAVAEVLAASDSTPQDRAEAQRRLDQARSDARTACIASGGHFIEGTGTTVGTCTK